MKLVYQLIAHGLIFFKRSFKLIITPYKEMRDIAEKGTIEEVYFILGISSLFLFLSAHVKALYGLQRISSSLIPVGIFLIQFFIIGWFFYSVTSITYRKASYKRMIIVLSYCLVPTLIWFLSTTLLFFILPPPRSLSLLGTGFSFVFLVWSIALLYWRMLLLYLSVRFGTKASFSSVLYMCILFLTWFLPYSFFLYRLGFFRIPFI